MGHHPVLLGLWSRGDWNHPGPALFYLLALPYRLSGGSLGLYVGALIINGAALVGMALVARRRGGTVFYVLTVVGCAALVWGLGPSFVRSPWNPSIPVLPFGLVVFLCWAAACGERWALPLAAAVASFCAQTHVGYVPLVLPLLIWAGIWLALPVLRAWRTHAPRVGVQLRALGGTALATAVVLGAMWLPPLIEEVRHRPGNLVNIREYFGTPSDDVATLGDGLRIVGSQLTLWPTWLRRERPLDIYSHEPLLLQTTPVPVLLTLVLIAAVVLFRRRHRDAGLLVATVGVAMALGVLSVSRVIGPVVDYRLAWANVLGMLAFLAVSWTAWLVLQRRNPSVMRRVLPVMAVALVLGGLVNTVDTARTTWHESPSQFSVVVDRLVPPTINALPKRAGVVLMRPVGRPAEVFQGMFLELERRGIDVRTDRPRGIIGSGADHRVWHGEHLRATVTVAERRELDDLLARGQQPVAYWGTPSPGERARRAGQAAALDAEHRSGDLGDVDYFVRTRRVSRGLERPATGVFMVHGGALPTGT